MLIIKPKITSSLASRSLIALCACVAAKPDDSNKNVFIKGIPKGFTGVIANGGHTPPIQIDGASDI